MGLPSEILLVEQDAHGHVLPAVFRHRVPDLLPDALGVILVPGIECAEDADDDRIPLDPHGIEGQGVFLKGVSRVIRTVGEVAVEQGVECRLDP